MKKDKNILASKDEKISPGSNPKNKFKKGPKGATVVSVNNILTGS